MLFNGFMKHNYLIKKNGISVVKFEKFNIKRKTFIPHFFYSFEIFAIFFLILELQVCYF